MNYVLIGDIHSQNHKLQSALQYIEDNIKDYYIIFLGDAFDTRCKVSDSVGVYNSIKKLQKNNRAVILQSNHQWKLQRYFYGNNVKIDESLNRTIEDFKKSDISTSELLSWLESLPYACSFRDNSNLEYRCAHAYYSSKLITCRNHHNIEFITKVSRQMRDKLLYGALNEGQRVLWWEKSSDNDWIRCAGHYHTIFISYENKSLVLDSCCGDDDGILSVYDINSRKLYQF